MPVMMPRYIVQLCHLCFCTISNNGVFYSTSDRFRTMINVLGDSIGAGLVYEMSKKELEELDEAAGINRPTTNNTGDMALETIETAKM